MQEHLQHRIDGLDKSARRRQVLLVVALIALGAFSAFSILHTVIKHPRTTVVIMTWPFAAVCEIHDKDICPLVTPNSFVEFTKSKLGLPHDAQIFPPD